MKLSCVLLILAACVASATAQAPPDKTLAGTVTIKSSGGSIAVLGKNPAAGGKDDFMFCIDQDRAGAQSIDFNGPARVLYRPQPIPGMPEGMTMSGPEAVASTLAVVTDSGPAWVFVAKGEKAITPPGKVNATTVNVTLVQRTDWAVGKGPRRGTDIQSCLSPGG